jgi:hypothetical protein
MAFGGHSQEVTLGILQSTDAYEAYLRGELGEEVVEEGLLEKRKEMASGPFPFLRATYSYCVKNCKKINIINGLWERIVRKKTP